VRPSAHGVELVADPASGRILMINHAQSPQTSRPPDTAPAMPGFAMSKDGTHVHHHHDQERDRRGGVVSAKKGHLSAVRAEAIRTQDLRFRVAAQAIVEGTQDIRVAAATPLAGPGHGQIAVRVGRLLVYVNEREALDSFVDAWRRAEALADKAFGPQDPVPYRPGL
jgi:hypothetical protein